MTPRARIALVVVGLLVLVVAFVIANGSSDTSKQQDRTVAGATTLAATTATPGATGTSTSTGQTDVPIPAVPVIKVVGAKPQGGVKRLTYVKGDTIRFTVQSDTADEIHVHGYDVHKDVAAGGKVTFSIPATIEGLFVVELERHATQIAELEVDPS
jgi:hypothetical protein